MAPASDPDPRLPFPGDALLRPDPLYAELRAAGPLARVRTPAGDPAWLAVRHAATKALFADPRLGRSHPHPERAARISASGVVPGPVGDHETEKADHTAMRRLVAPAFSARRMARLADHVQATLDGLLDAMVAEHDRTGGPVDLHAHVSVPLPARILGELLGVPAADHDWFAALSRRATGLAGADPQAALGELAGYASALLAAKDADPGEDVVSDLAAARRERPGFDEADAVGIVIMLLIAGFETTMAFTDLGTVLLLRHPAVLDTLRADPDTAGPVVEEVLRLGGSGGVGMVRYAHTDVDVTDEDGRGATIAAGDAVLLSMSSANHDGRVFDDPDAFAPFAGRAPHVALGHGPHYCLGAPLARIELRAVFTTLAARLPDLRLAVDEAQVERADSFVGGLAALPVTW